MRAVPWLLMLVVAAIGALSLTRLELVTDMTFFLPSGADPELSELSTELARSELSRSSILLLRAPSEQETLEAAAALALRLEESPEVAWVRSGDRESFEEAIHAVYFPHRFALLSDAPDSNLARALSDEGLSDASRELKRRLGLPSGGLERAFAASDPWMAFANQVRRIEAVDQGTLRPVGGQLLTEDGRAVLLLSSRASPFDARASRRFVGALDEAIHDVRGLGSGELDVEQAGMHRIALASERSIRADVQRISIVSSVGVLLLFLALFRSARSVFLTAVPVLTGVSMALAVCLLLFGRVHGLTLAFGAALIGVCVDYPVHLINHHHLDPGEGGEASLRRVFPGLLLGSATTVAGFLGLAWASFPGLREMAIFASVGVVAALLATRFISAPLLPKAPRSTALQRGLASGLAAAFLRLRGRRLVHLLPLVILAVGAFGLTRLSFVDDIRALDRRDPALLAEDARVRDAVSPMEAGRFVVSVGATEEEALRRNDAAALRLAEAVGEEELGGFRTLHSFVWSESLQRRNLDAIATSPRLAERTLDALEAEGFRRQSFAPFVESVSESPDVLRPDDLRGGPLEDLARPFRARLGERHAVLSFLREVRDAEALSRRFDDLEGVHYFDQVRYLGDAYGRYRERALTMVGLGLFAVFGLVLLRYRSLRLGLAAFLPALFSAVATLGLLGWLGEEVHLLNVVALLLVLSIGVDYGVFMVEHRASPRALGATLTSVVIACVTTCLSFGLLALSASPALHAIGLTVGVGVLLSLLFAPMALLALGAAPESE